MSEQQQQGPSFDEVSLIVGRIVFNNTLLINRLEAALAQAQARLAVLEEHQASDQTEVAK